MLASKNVLRTWLFMTIITITVVNVFGSGEKRLDLKIGFDLTQGANGAPSIRIRDFEESSEIRPRAKEDTIESKETKPKSSGKVRADSFSDSDEPVRNAHQNKRDSSKESKEDAKSNNDNGKSEDDNDSSGDRERSTKGLNAGEYDPEENPKIHVKYRDSEEDSDKSLRRRRKRNAFFASKWRKFV